MAATRGLTDKPITKEVLEEDGRTVAAHVSTVVTDPDSADAVQVLDPNAYPSANASAHDDLAAHTQSSPADFGDADEASVNEQQSITLDDTAAGEFTLSFDGDTTDPIAFDATASAVKDALVDLASIGTNGEGDDNVTVSGSAGGPWTVTFVNDLAAQDVAPLTGAADGLDAHTPTAVVTTTVQGAV